MPPRVVGPPRKEACILILDVGASMARAEDDGRESKLIKAQKSVQLLIQQKLLFTKQDELGIVLVGTEDTANDLALEANDDESYQHVSVLRPLQKPDLAMLESISSIEASSCTRGDCIDAILVAMHILHARVGKLRFQKRIFLVTDAAAPIVNDPEAMEAIADGMKRDEFKLNIIGVGFKDDDDDEAADGQAKKEEGGDADMGDDDEERKHGDGPARPAASSAAAAAGGVHVKKEMDHRTETQRANESLLKSFAASVDGVVFNATNAISMLSAFRSRAVNQVTKFRGILDLGGACNINVWSYGKTALQNMATMKKQSVAAAAAAADGGDGDAAAAAGGGWRGGGGGSDDEGEGGGFAAAGGDEGGIAMERTYLNKLGEREKEVAAENRIKSFRYGKEQVPFSEEDLEQLKFKTEKGIKILSFAPQKSIPRHHYMSNVDCIVAEPGDFSSALQLSALIHACYDTAKVAVVRYVKRNNDRPLLGILLPVVKADVECFYFNQLPFEEDIREFSFAGLDDVKVTPNQLEAAKALITSMNLMTAAVDEDGEAGEALVPKHTFNPALQRFYQVVQARALDPDADISELDPEISKYIMPDPSLMRRAAAPLNNFKACFELKPVEASEKKQKRHWKDWYSSEVKDADIEDIRKRMRPGEEAAASSAAAAAAAAGGASQDSRLGGSSAGGGSFSFEAAVSTLVDKVGMMRPLDDFLAMVARRDDPAIVPRAIAELIEAIHYLLDHSFQGSHYERALSCIRGLRTECVKMEEADKFNALLGSLKAECAPSAAQPRKKHADFWNRMHAVPVLPIHAGEVGASSVSEEDAHNFYSGDVELPVSAPPPPAAADVDELFDSME